MLNIDLNSLEAGSKELNENLKYYDLYGAPIVEEYSKELDTVVDRVRNYMRQIKEYNLDYDILSLQNIVIDLSSTIYFTSDRLEKLGILEDLANIKYKDKYNEAYLAKQGNYDAGKKYTVEQLRNYAEQEALNERLISFIYSHAAKVIKGKLDAANEVLKATSKCLSATMQTMQTYQYSNKYTA